MLLIILFTVIFETGLNALMNWLKNEGLTVFVRVVDKVTGELMILGTISFTILMIIEATLDAPQDNWFLKSIPMLELAHIWIFTIGVLFAVLAIAWLAIATADRLRWMSFDILPREALTQTILAMTVAEQRISQTGGAVGRRIEMWRTIWCPTRSTELIDFHVLRRFFLAKYFPLLSEVYGEDLALTPARADKSFRFGRLLNRLMEAKVQEQMEVSATAWVIFVVVLAVGVTLNWVAATDADSQQSLRWLNFALSWGVCGVVIVLAATLRLLRRAFLVEAVKQLGFGNGTTHVDVVRELVNKAFRNEYATVRSDEELCAKEQMDAGAIGSATKRVRTPPPPAGRKQAKVEALAAERAAATDAPSTPSSAKRAHRRMSNAGVALVLTCDKAAAVLRRTSTSLGGEVDNHATPSGQQREFPPTPANRSASARGWFDGAISPGTAQELHSAAGSLSESPTMQWLRALKSPSKRGRVLAVLVPKITEKAVLFQLGLISFVLILGIPEGLGLREGVNYKGGSDFDPYVGILFFVLLSLLPSVFGLLVLQPMVLKDATLLSSCLCSEEHKRALLHGMHERIVGEQELRLRFINLVITQGAGAVDFLFESEKMTRLLDAPNVKRKLRKSHWVASSDNTVTSTANQGFILSVASELHNMWRGARRRLSDGTFDPRIKTINGVKYDIANLTFLELPKELQRSNFESAKNVCDSLDVAIRRGCELDEAFVEWASDELHENWIEHNKSWADESQLVAYIELSDEEKEKDRVIVLAALDVYEKNMAVQPIDPASVVTIAMFGKALKLWGVELLAIDLKVMWELFAPQGQIQCLTIARLQEQVDKYTRQLRSSKQMVAGLARMRIRLGAIRTSKRAMEIAQLVVADAARGAADLHLAGMSTEEIAQQLCGNVMYNIKAELMKEAEVFRRGVGRIFPKRNAEPAAMRRKSSVLRSAARAGLASVRLAPLTPEKLEAQRAIHVRVEEDAPIDISTAADPALDAPVGTYNDVMRRGYRPVSRLINRGNCTSATSWEYSLAAKLHNEWRSKRPVLSGGTIEPRLMHVDDVKYDIANLAFAALPVELQASNYNAARCAAKSLDDAKRRGQPFDDAFIEWAAARQHDDWCVADVLVLAPRLNITRRRLAALLPSHCTCRLRLAHVRACVRVRSHARFLSHPPSGLSASKTSRGRIRVSSLTSAFSKKMRSLRIGTSCIVPSNHAQSARSSPPPWAKAIPYSRHTQAGQMPTQQIRGEPKWWSPVVAVATRQTRCTCCRAHQAAAERAVTPCRELSLHPNRAPPP
jgi:hypothetical protein